MAKPSRTAASENVGRVVAERLGRFVENLKQGGLKGVASRRIIRANIVNAKIEPATYNARAVKTVRMKIGASQIVFAQFLGVSPSAVRSWEQGKKLPQRSARRMLDEIANNPEYFHQRLLQLAEVGERESR